MLALQPNYSNIATLAVPVIMKSRTVVGRTIAKVKNRISSIGSLVGTTDSPNPLLAHPPAEHSSLQFNAPPTPTPVATRPLLTSLDGTSIPPTSTPNVPPIAALKITQESWTVFNTHPKYHATAYIKFDIFCINQNGGRTITLPPDTDPGHLHSLTVDLSLTGPGVLLHHYGELTCATITKEAHWINLMYIGIKDTSLASKLSTSLRSLGRSAGRSAGRLRRYTNIDLINRWLHVLEADDNNTGAREAVEVHAVVTYKHSFLPESTMLKDTASCRVKMTREEMERARIAGNEYIKSAEEMGPDGEEEDEERLREARVLGAPWL